MIKQLLKNLVLGEKASSQKYVAYLRRQGVQIGENVRFYSPSNTLVDISCPWLVSIGNNVCITHGVIILTHDYSWAVLKQISQTKGAVLGAKGRVKIGNNVFIGMNAIITRGVTVGDNVVIGAGSVVTKDCESGFVYAGNPARKLMSIEEYANKRRSAQLTEAKAMVKAHMDRFGTPPKQEDMAEYFMLFCDLETAEKTPAFRQKMESGKNYSDTLIYMKNHPPIYKDYQAFIQDFLDKN